MLPSFINFHLAKFFYLLMTENHLSQFQPAGQYTKGKKMKKFLPVVLIVAATLSFWSSNSYAALSTVISSRTAGAGDTAAGTGTSFDNLGAWVLTVNAGDTLASTGAVGISVNTSSNGGAFGGTVTFLGASTVSGTIGSLNSSVLAVNAGAPTTTVTFASDVFANTTSVTGTGTLAFSGTLSGTSPNGAGLLTFTGDGTVTLADTKNITVSAGITNGGAANSITGTLRSLGTSTIVNQVGTAALALREVSGGVAAKTTTFSSDVFALTTTITGAGTITLSGNLTGTAAGLSSVAFIGDGTLTLADAKNINVSGGITNLGAAASTTGTFRSLGTSTITGQVGTAALALREVSGGVAAKTTTFSSDVFALTTTITGAGTITLSGNLTGTAAGLSSVAFIGDGTLTLADAKNINVSGGITNLGAAASTTGTFRSLGTSTITGQVGTAALALREVSGGVAAKITTFSSDVYALTTSITGTGTMIFNGNITGTAAGLSSVNFIADGGLTIADNKNITVSGGIRNTGAANSLQGNLLAIGTSTISGQVGTAALALTTIRAGGAAETVTFASDVYANTTSVTGTGTIAFSGSLSGTAAGLSLLDFAADGTVTLADTKTISVSGGITNATTNQGTLILAGTHTITGAVGSTTAGLRQITLSSSTAATTTVFGTVKATNFSLGLNTLATTVITLPASGTIATTANSGTAFGKITSTGAATLGGSGTVAVTVGGYIPNGASLVVIDGTGGTAISGGLSVTSTSPNVTFAANSAAAADLTLTATRTTTATTSTNSTAVATAINSAGTPTGDFATALGAIDALTTSAAVDAAYKTMDPVVNAGANAASFDQVSQSLGTVTEHLSDIRSGTAGQAGVSTGDEWKDAGWWVKGFGTHADQGTRSGINGYKANMWGTAVGTDGLVTDNTRIGLAGSYASTSVDNKGEAGGTDIDSYQGTVYVSYDDPSPWYADGAFSFTWNSYDGTRNILIGSAVSRTAKSSPDGQQYTGLLDIGYVWKNMDMEKGQEWDITPMAGFTYSHLNIDRYTETGAGDLNLAVSSQGYDLAQSSLGVKLSRPYKNSSGTYVPEIHGNWLYDFVGDKVATTAKFTGGGSSFDTRGAAPAQSSFDVGAGLTLYEGNMSVSLVYDFEIKSKYTSHTGQAVLRYKF